MTENETKTAEQKKRDLYLLQKELLATILEHGAISQAQHNKSLGDLTGKMGMLRKPAFGPFYAAYSACKTHSMLY